MRHFIKPSSKHALKSVAIDIINIVQYLSARVPVGCLFGGVNGFSNRICEIGAKEFHDAYSKDRIP